MMARTKKQPPQVTEALNWDDLDDILTPEQKQALLAKKQQQTSISQLRADYEALAEKEVIDLVENLKALEAQLIVAKTEVYRRMAAVIAKKRAAFAVDANQRVFSFTYQKRTLEIGYSTVDGWKDTATAGLEKIRAFQDSLVHDDDSKILHAFLSELMKTTRKNQISLPTLIKLENMLTDVEVKKCKNFALFKDAVTILREAYDPQLSCWSVRAAFRDGQNKLRPISTSLSSAKFAADFDFKGF